MKIIVYLFLMLLFVPVISSTADAQKKKKATEEAPVISPAPLVPPTQGSTQSQKASESFRVLLLKYEGWKTNLGKLTKVGSDYIVIEDEDGATVHALSSVASLRAVKVEEEEGVKNELEIKLLSRE